jgi:hypothetical protein
MLLITHILVALASIVLTTYSLFRPSKATLNTGYGLAALTLVSGTVLVISSGSNLLRSCLTGITYFGIVAIGLKLAKAKLAKQEIEK